MKISPARQVTYSLQKCQFCSVSIISLTHGRLADSRLHVPCPSGLRSDTTDSSVGVRKGSARPRLRPARCKVLWSRWEQAPIERGGLAIESLKSRPPNGSWRGYGKKFTHLQPVLLFKDSTGFAKNALSISKRSADQ